MLTASSTLDTGLEPIATYCLEEHTASIHNCWLTLGHLKQLPWAQQQQTVLHLGVNSMHKGHSLTGA